MKLIDEKGKIFGKVNIIDLLVILIVIAAAVFLILRQFSGESEEPAQQNSVGITYQVKVTRVEPSFYEAVKQYVDRDSGKRDQMYSSDTDTILSGYVVDCEATPHVEYVTTSDGQLKRVESSGDDKRLDLVFTMEAEATNLNSNLVGGQQIRVGVSNTVKTTHFECYGTVIGYVREDG